MARDNQPIPPRAMIVSRKYRTLVSSWIEPLQEEAELGYEIDYIARYVFPIGFPSFYRLSQFLLCLYNLSGNNFIVLP